MLRTPTTKEAVRGYWDAAPCGTRHVPAPPGTDEFFEQTQQRRYALEPFVHTVAQFDRWRGKQVLEIGCGTGVDLLQFARGGAEVCAVDLSWSSCTLARRRLERNGLSGRIMVADAEGLPFPSESFDLVYSWGVLHHTPDIEAAVGEVHRVLTHGGNALVMLYHSRSWFAWKLWFGYGLLAGRPFRSLRSVIAEHLESPGTQAFTTSEVRALFRRFSHVETATLLTPYDKRPEGRFAPPAVAVRLFGDSLGWFIVVRARK